jgi:hypothetical protein
MGRRDNKGERPYVITYIKGARRLSDSAITLDGAKTRIAARLAKRHNKGEIGRVYFQGSMVFSTDPTDAVLALLNSAVKIAAEAQDEWDKAPSGMRAGKILIALAGGCPGYRADIDAIHAAIAKAEGR